MVSYYPRATGADVGWPVDLFESSKCIPQLLADDMAIWQWHEDRRAANSKWLAVNFLDFKLQYFMISWLHAP